MSGTTTASYITDTSYFQPFYYLKITGLPYYFFSIVDPTSSAYGAAAWTLPSGYSAVRGMQLPDDTLDQALPDLIGGIASAERIRLSMLDFRVPDVNGDHSFFGRLLAPGRITTSGSAALGQLSSDIKSDGTTVTIDVQNIAANAFAASTDVYVGGETIGIGSVSGPSGTPSQSACVITARNKFPCTSTYPPTPYHRVVKDASGNVSPAYSVTVTQEPLTFIGRTAALYIGHMTPDGKPEPEANALCRLVGRIKSVDYGQQPATYQFTIESVMADLAATRVAPGLAHATIQDGIYLQPATWCSFAIYVESKNSGSSFGSNSKAITVAAGIYSTPADLARAINDQLVANPMTANDTAAGTADITFHCHLSAQSNKFVFSAEVNTGVAGNWTFAVSDATSSGQGGQLLRALGFDPGYRSFTSGDATPASILADREAPRVFIPCVRNGGTSVVVALTDSMDVNGDHFFTNQGDTQAYVRFPNGELMGVSAHSASSLTLIEVNRTTTRRPDFYYAGPSDTPVVDQVIQGFPAGPTTGEKLYGRLLASTAAAIDGEYSIYPEGVGLGLIGILDTASFRQLAAFFPWGPLSEFFVDAQTKFGDLWGGVSKELGAYLVWDPSVGQIALRMLQQPSAAVASTFQFDESNRIAPGDRTQAGVDYSTLRTGLTFRYGYDQLQKKFMAPDTTITDYSAISNYQIESRLETIQDIVLDIHASQLAGQLIGQYIAKSTRLQYPWLKATRTVNKRGLLLSPGTYHKIVDATINNPFTGVMGIASGDNVYGWLMSTSSNLSTGDVKVTFLIDQVTDGDGIRIWAPTGLVDFGAASNGYDNATGIVTFTIHYSSDPTKYDGFDFRVGDTIALIPRDNDGAPAYEKTSTITAVATDGHTVTVAAGLGAISSTVETIMILRPYGSATTARKSGADKVAFQGSGDTLLINSTAKLHKWS